MPKSKSPKTYPIVHIVWEDAVSPGSHWMSKKQFQKDCKVMLAHSVGYLVSEDESGYVIMQSYFPDDKAGDRSCGTAIPKGCVKQIIPCKPEHITSLDT